MSKPKAPKRPESEKIAEKRAIQFFNKGSAVKNRNGKAFLADKRADHRGANEARVSASSAIQGRKAIAMKRRGKKINLATATVAGRQNIGGASMVSGMKQSERIALGAMGASKAGTNALAGVTRASGVDHADGMNNLKIDVDQSNRNLEGVAAVASAYLDKRENDAADAQAKKDKGNHQAKLDATKNGLGGTSIYRPYSPTG